MRTLSLKNFMKELLLDEVSKNTINNYAYAVSELLNYLKSVGEYENFSKEDIINYKNVLKEKYTCTETINNRLNSINGYLKRAGMRNFSIKLLPMKKNMFLDDDEIFTDEEITLILKEAEKLKNKRLYMTFRILLQTGIRVFEMEFITYEAVVNKKAIVRNKGKERLVPIPDDLRELLLEYCKGKNITSGPVIRTRNGIRVHRSYLYRQVHRFITKLGVTPNKAHPHALRHKFAINYLRTYGENAISNLADILGHESVETTRVYLRKTISEIRESMTLEKLGIKIAS